MLKSRHLRILILRKQSWSPVHFNGTEAAVDYVMSKEFFFFFFALPKVDPKVTIWNFLTIGYCTRKYHG